MTRRLYVAGSSREIPRVRVVMDAARAAGWIITYDWTHEVERLGSAPPDPLLCEEAAARDLAAIREADLVVLLVPSSGAPTKGAWWEAGYAQGIGKPVIATGDRVDLAGMIFVTTCDGAYDGEALVAVLHAWSPR